MSAETSFFTRFWGRAAHTYLSGGPWLAAFLGMSGLSSILLWEARADGQGLYLPPSRLVTICSSAKRKEKGSLMGFQLGLSSTNKGTCSVSMRPGLPERLKNWEQRDLVFDSISVHCMLCDLGEIPFLHWHHSCDLWCLSDSIAPSLFCHICVLLLDLFNFFL